VEGKGVAGGKQDERWDKDRTATKEISSSSDRSTPRRRADVMVPISLRRSMSASVSASAPLVPPRPILSFVYSCGAAGHNDYYSIDIVEANKNVSAAAAPSA
jgi:hypothetical protein